jgi:hypothetical protein
MDSSGHAIQSARRGYSRSQSASANAQPEQVRRAGATEMLNLSSAKRDRSAKPFPPLED